MAAITTGLLSAGVAAYTIAQGAKEKREAKDALNHYERQTLNNAFDNIQISTAGSDLLRDENGRTSANLVDASRQGGIRGVFGGIPQIQAFNNQANAEGEVYLDNQFKNREYSVAQDNARIRDINENRDNQNLNALSSEYQSGKQDMWNGINGGIRAVGMVANGVKAHMDEDSPRYPNTPTDLAAAGYADISQPLIGSVPTANPQQRYYGNLFGNFSY